MATSELGQLESVDVRGVWHNEAQDFTPWLRENIELLGKALGLELEASATEVPVGEFKVDLLGRDINSSRPVIVENQLEQTNHGHLGQLLTYAAGLDAGVIIWITREFRDEHRQALNWLNSHTMEGIDFFGVEIEVLKIGGSLPAPHFRLVAQPNEWVKTTVSAANAAGAGSAEINRRRAEFLQFWRISAPGVLPNGAVGEAGVEVVDDVRLT